jgi:hypothetical protein
MTIEQERFPIGQFECPTTIENQDVQNWIQQIAEFPQKIKTAVIQLNDEQLDTCYRANGWTIRQVVHHCADSHMNSIIRLKLALTEEQPTIRPYFEDQWAELVDSQKFPIAASLQILEGVHTRWKALLEKLDQNDLTKTYIHPEHGKVFQIREYIALYAWHCEHHLAHITHLKERKGWK